MKIRDIFKYGNTSQQRRKGVSRYLIRCSERALMCSPVDFGVPYRGGLRLVLEQMEIFKDGNSSCDGINDISYHQKTDSNGEGLALDLVPYIKGIGYCYDAYGRFGIIGMLMLEAWQELQDEGLIPEDLFLHWGGLWSHKDPKKLGWDMAHFEIRTYPQIEKV